MKMASGMHKSSIVCDASCDAKIFLKAVCHLDEGFNHSMNVMSRDEFCDAIFFFLPLLGRMNKLLFSYKVDIQYTRIWDSSDIEKQTLIQCKLPMRV